MAEEAQRPSDKMMITTYGQAHGEEPIIDGDERERWTSRLTFVLGAIGSAVGLGNIWRFPRVAFENGGAAFLIPYALAFFLFGVPLLFLELLMGRHFQGGDPVCFGGINPRLKGIGWASVLNSFIIVSYYNVIIAWTFIYLIHSFRNPLPWTYDTSHFLFTETLMLPDDVAAQNGANYVVLLAFLIVWVAVFLSIYKGVEVVSKVVMITVPLPVILLFVLLFTNLSVEGSGLGVTAYFGRVDWEAFEGPGIWQQAVGQIFFSIGTCFGVMTAYSSYRDPDEGVLADTFYIATFNSGVSILSGFVVFTALGSLAFEQGVTELTKETAAAANLAVGGPSLVFAAYPQALSNSASPQIFSILFFGVIFFLALDSAFSLVEAVTTAINDSPMGKRMSREYVTFYVCFTCFLAGLYYCLDNGLYVLDVVDFYVNNFGMILLGALECVGAAWVFHFDDAADKVGRSSAMQFVYAYWISMTVAVAFIAFAPGDIAIGAVAAIPLLGIWMFVAFGLRTNKDIGFGEYVNIMTTHGTSVFTNLMFRVEFKGVEEGFRYTFAKVFSFVWVLSVKYVIPTALYLVLVTSAVAEYNSPYEGYPGFMANTGRFVFFLGVFIMAIYYVVEGAYVTAVEMVLENEEDNAAAQETLVVSDKTEEDELPAFTPEI